MRITKKAHGIYGLHYDTEYIPSKQTSFTSGKRESGSYVQVLLNIYQCFMLWGFIYKCVNVLQNDNVKVQLCSHHAISHLKYLKNEFICWNNNAFEGLCTFLHFVTQQKDLIPSFAASRVAVDSADLQLCCVRGPCRREMWRDLECLSE